MKVVLRPLKELDAYSSYHWRNDHRIWAYTGKAPSKNINLEDELAWIRTVLAGQNEKRFAICVGKSAKYIGNVQLTNIAANQAEFHIFIGDKSMHGLGIGSQATVLLLNYSKKFLGLNEIYLYVHKDNIPAINLYKKCGFLFFGYSTENRLKFICKL